ncbi:MAG: TadE/TadG family type IV pilus assembly protein [Collinsella sp.]|nr:TadE/TadG family type IV pilus assembly protein [Collinsella sp.]
MSAHRIAAKGQATVELVLITPILLLLLLIMLDGAVMASAIQTSSSAAEQAARAMSHESTFMRPMSEEELVSYLDASQEVSAAHEWHVKVEDLPKLDYKSASGEDLWYYRKGFEVTCVVKVRLPLPLPDIDGMTEDGSVIVRSTSSSVLAVEAATTDGSWG